MMIGKTGIVLGVIIILLSGLMLTFMFDAPTQSGGGLADPSNLPVKGYMNITIYADAAGWNYSHGAINPTLYFPLYYVINFTVIEEDNLPHTLTINTGPTETSSSLTLLSTGQITQIPGHVSKVSYEFFKTGIYTYWCMIHPTTMVGQIEVNSTASNNTTAATVCYTSNAMIHSFESAHDLSILVYSDISQILGSIKAMTYTVF